MGFDVDTRLGSFDAVAGSKPQHKPSLVAIRELVADVRPNTVETASDREGSVWWGLGRQKMKAGFAWAMPHTGHVNFGFFQGAHLPDPARRLEGTGKSLRHIKIKEPGEVAHPSVRALVEAAVAERRAALEKE